MKITAFNGSPRGRSSNTCIMVNEFLQGTEKAGAHAEQVFLSEKKIGFCLGCFKCWIATPGKCVLKDDMTELLEKVLASDLIIMATPVYVDGVTAMMKGFMDRLIPLADPHFELDENGEWRHPLRYENSPEIVVISNSGMPGRAHFQALELHFRRMARNFHSTVVAEIYRDSGELLNNQLFILKPVISKYKKNLRNAGEEFLSSGAISAETIKKLEKPLINGAMYIKEANKHWDRQLSKLDN